MISVIICSRNPLELELVKNNVKDTIGVPFEMVIIDNRDNKYNIFTAYNEGVSRAKGDIICFMHEDIIFYTNNWGELVAQHFMKDNVGLIGVVGTHLLFDKPYPWWSANANCGQCIQYKSTDDTKKCVKYWARKTGESIEAVAVDGLWFCIRKRMFEKVAFDDVSFSGFHCYDLDICMQVLKAGAQVRVAYDIEIEHKSLGDLNETFYHNLEIWHKKWHFMLPITKGGGVDVAEISERCKRVEDFYNIKNAYDKSIQVYSSRAYKLGSAFLKPMLWVKYFLGF